MATINTITAARESDATIPAHVWSVNGTKMEVVPIETALAKVGLAKLDPGKYAGRLVGYAAHQLPVNPDGRGWSFCGNSMKLWGFSFVEHRAGSWRTYGGLAVVLDGERFRLVQPA